jgi:hypothetical protein
LLIGFFCGLPANCSNISISLLETLAALLSATTISASKLRWHYWNTFCRNPFFFLQQLLFAQSQPSPLYKLDIIHKRISSLGSFTNDFKSVLLLLYDLQF